MLTIRDALILPSDVLTINKFAKITGIEKITAIIEAYIIDYLDFINPVRRMTSTQITTTAELIHESYGILKVPELNLIFKNAKKGVYGANYEGIDGQKILSWFANYFEERLNEAERISNLEHQQQKKQLNQDLLTDEQLRKLYENARNNTKIPKKEIQKNEDLEYLKFKENYYNNKK